MFCFCKENNNRTLFIYWSINHQLSSHIGKACLKDIYIINNKLCFQIDCFLLLYKDQYQTVDYADYVREIYYPYIKQFQQSFQGE